MIKSIKNRLYKSRLYKKIIFSIMIAVLSISGILVAGVYLSSIDKIEELSRDSYEISSEQLINSMKMQMEYYDMKLLNIGMQTNTKKLFSKEIDMSLSKDRELLLDIRGTTLNLLREYYVNNVIFCSFKNQKILDSSWYNIEDYYNLEYLKAIKDIQTHGVDSNLSIEFFDQSFLITRAYPIASKDKMGIVSLELKNEVLTELINKSMSNVLLLTSQGEEVFREGSDIEKLNITSTNIDSILTMDQEWHSIDFEEESYYVLHNDSFIGDLHYAFLISEKEFEGLYKSLDDIIITLIFIMLIITAMTVFGISYYIYKPIRSVTDYVARNQHVDQSIFRDELEFIKNVYLGMSHSNEHMAQLIEENKPVMRERFLYRILKGEDLNHQEVQEKAQYYELKFPFECYTVVTIEYAAEENEEQISELSVMNGLSRKIREKGYTTYGIDLFFNRLSLLICHEKEFEIRSFIKNVFIENNYTSDKLVIGIGGVVESLTEANKSFASSIENLEEQLGRGLNVHYEQGEIDYNLYQQCFKYEKKIFNALILKSRKKMEEEFDVILMELQVDEIENINVLRDIFLHLFATILRVVSESGSDITKLVDEKQLYCHIRKCNDHEGFIRILKEVSSTVNEHLVNKNNDGSQKLVEGVKKIIESRYKEVISVDSIADEVFLSKSHLIRVFKKYAGKSLNDYINDVRINESKKLLLETTWSVEKVSQNVGYNNIQSYLRNFRKRAGVTPNEFRKNHVKGLF